MEMTRYLDAMFIIPYAVRCHWWVMAIMEVSYHSRPRLPAFRILDLLRHQSRLSGSIFPLSKVELSQERIEWLLLSPVFVTSTAILLLQCAKKPLQNKHRAFGWVWL